MKNQNGESVEKILEEVAMQGVAAVAPGSASSTRDITEDEEYEKFVESMVPHCRCTGQPRPCDGVLAGGLCDNIHDDPSDDEETSEERYDREVYGDEWHTQCPCKPNIQSEPRGSNQSKT